MLFKTIQQINIITKLKETFHHKTKTNSFTKTTTTAKSKFLFYPYFIKVKL